MEAVDQLLMLLLAHKQQLEMDTQELRLEMMLEFLYTSRCLKEKSLGEKRSHLQHIASDMNIVGPPKMLCAVS